MKTRFALCVDNAEYPASLEVRKLYRVVPDKDVEREGDLRIIDESGEDYIYPGRYFVAIDLPREAERVLKDSFDEVETGRGTRHPSGRVTELTPTKSKSRVATKIPRSLASTQAAQSFDRIEITRSSKHSSPEVAELAAVILADKKASKIAKRLAGWVLAQARTSRQTGGELEEVASKVMRSGKYSKETKTLAASVLAQANKER